MQGNLSNVEPEKGMLSQVREGMFVVDLDGNEIGKVREVFFGEANPEALDMGRGPADVSDKAVSGEERMLDDFSFGGAGYSEDVREEEFLKAQMQRYGYIRVEGTGLFASDRIVLSDQIASVEDDHVRLNVLKDDVAKT